MPLLSAFEDFFQRSVSALPNLWERLCFVGGLRNHAGQYRHYGMEQRFGESEAQAAIAAAHSVLFEELASTPLKELWRTAETHGGEASTDICVLLKTVPPRGRKTRDFLGVPAEHIQFVTTNLIRVAESRDRASRAAA
jgi:hypothetical protein